ncbi:MAG TPA: GtrA family protein [Acidimicrobiales bacterium]|nr:GtrA family protein [Acidimicrobiales bacterium]
MPAVVRATELARRHLGKRFLLYAVVSGVATVITQVTLAVLHGLVGWRASLSNIAAVCIATPVSYYMNRAWVWQKRGKSNLTKEVAPFWAFSFAGLLLSTLLVGLVALWQNVPVGDRPTAFQQLQINLANAVGFGILWLIQFFVLDKISFKPHVGRGAQATAETDDAGAEAQRVAPPLHNVSSEAETW